MKRVIVRAPVLSMSGYGVHSRLVLNSLRSREDIFDIYLINTNWGQTGWLSDDNEERNWIDHVIAKTHNYISQDGKFDLSVQITIPNEWERIAPVNIGVTAGIESTKISAEWVKKSNLVDRIIVISEHAKYGFANTVYQGKNEKTGEEIKELKCDAPITVVNYPVREFEPKELEGFELKTSFNFLTVAQWSPRKNLENTIRWWVEEFIDKKVGLIVKTSIRNSCRIDREFTEKRIKSLLEKYPQRKCSVYLLHGDLSNEEMTWVYQHPKVKAVVSLAHGEGFGLPLFEAAYNGVPVIAPDWGGQNDFLHIPQINKKKKKKKRSMFSRVEYDLKPVQKEAVWKDVLIPESMWCYAKQGSYKMKLREMHNQHKQMKTRAQKLQKYILENFKKDEAHKKYVDAILGPEHVEPRDFEGVSFCIPTNGAKEEKTRLLIKSIKNLITTKKTEIVVAGDVEKFKDLEKENSIKLVDAKDVAYNGFLAELRNIAARNASQDVFCYIDDDMVLPPGWLWRLEQYSRNEGWEVLGNRIFNPDGSRLWDRALIHPHVLVPYEHPENDKRLYQTGGFGIHRKEVFEELQWDGSIPIYAEGEDKPNEDIDYSLRLHRKGYTHKFDKENTTWHWDNNYTEIQYPDGNRQTLRKQDIIKHFGQSEFPAVCEEFNDLMSVLGAQSV